VQAVVLDVLLGENLLKLLLVALQVVRLKRKLSEVCLAALLEHTFKLAAFVFHFVNLYVLLQVRRRPEPLLAHGALVWLLPCVSLLVPDQVGLVTKEERAARMCAGIRLKSVMHSCVVKKAAFVFELLIAVLTIGDVLIHSL